MTATETGLRKTFVQAVLDMATSPQQATKIFRTSLLRLHPDKVPSTQESVAQALTQHLTSIHTMIRDGTTPVFLMHNLRSPRFVDNLSRGSESSLCGDTVDPSDDPAACGREYRSNDAVRRRQWSPDDLVYERAKTTNPELFKRRVLRRLPAHLKPGRPPSSSPYGDMYWVGTDEGRAIIARAIDRVEDPPLREKLRRDAGGMGFDVDAVLGDAPRDARF